MGHSCDRNDLRIISSFTERVLSVKDKQELEKYEREFWGRLSEQARGSEEVIGLWQHIMAVSLEMLRLKAANDDLSRDRRIAKLSDGEKAELARVEEIIDKNLFIYHFQPIVSAVTGDIFSYEALMRTAVEPRIPPDAVIRYAGLLGRLGDIERLTFKNVLRCLEDDPEAFEGKRVFINSMPNVGLGAKELGEIDLLLGRHSKQVVVEITEQAEMDEFELNSFKDRFDRLNIRIAIDDYGTGYSNVHNLLRYAPNCVKIDRSLLSGINSDTKKKHFVRQIIDFCRENKIMSLAEGVETREELRTVIMFGVDLIQGFYTARPSAEVKSGIAYDVKREIMRCSQEREDGRTQQVYNAAKGERILLERLVSENYTGVMIGSGYNDGTVEIVGDTMLDTEIYVETAAFFGGKVVLENAHLSNVKSRPSFDCGECSNFELELRGDNRFAHTGLRAPESAELTVTGIGSLTITLDSNGYYGIGNDLASRNGRINLDQDATIRIDAACSAAVLIGSGYGGEINFNKGKYELKAGGTDIVGIGAMGGDVKLELQQCDVRVEVSGSETVGIGSLKGNADLYIHHATVRCYVSGQKSVATGSIYGDEVKVHIDCTNTWLMVQAGDLAVLGSFEGNSDINVERALFKSEAGGYDALVFGGSKGSTKVSIVYVDAEISLVSTHHDKMTLAKAEDITTVGGRLALTVNHKPYEL